MPQLKKHLLLLLLASTYAIIQAQDDPCQQKIMSKNGVILKTTRYKPPAGSPAQNNFLEAVQHQLFEKYKPKGIAVEPYHIYYSDNQPSLF